MSRLTPLLFATCALGLVTGCNAIFGIHDGTLAEGGAGGAGSGAGMTDGGATSNGGGGATNTGGDGGGGGVPFDECDPSTFTDGDATQVVGDSCGLFVDTSSPTVGVGTKSAPFQTLQDALTAQGSGVNIYIKGAPTMVGGFFGQHAGNIYGGLNDNWSRNKALRPTLDASSWPGEPNVPLLLVLTPQDNVVLDSLILIGKNRDSEEDGTSFGLAVLSGNVRIQFSDIHAGNGGFGHNGAPGDPGDPGNPGNGAPSGCLPNNPALGGARTCIDGTVVDGGNGSICSSTQGMPGQPGSGPNGGGSGGSGVCTAGQQGPAGAHGMPGMRGPDIGDFSNMNLDLGAAPRAPNGVHGGGGGGGGGRAGFSGAGGGSGGCAGQGGEGGGNGGGSFAIGLFQSTLDLIDTKLSTGRPGPGGSGGSGGQGASGGQFGQGGGTNACNGGPGGDAGYGGNGAGGNGGIAALIIDDNATITLDQKTIDKNSLPQQVGAAGLGGSNGFSGPAPDGLDGKRCLRLTFTGPGNHNCLMALQ